MQRCTSLAYTRGCTSGRDFLLKSDLILYQEQAFLEYESEGLYTRRAGIVEGIFLPGFQSGYQGGNLFYPAYAIGLLAARGLFLIHYEMDDIPVNGDTADEPVLLAGAVQKNIRADDTQGSVFEFQGEQRNDIIIFDRPCIGTGGAAGMCEVLYA